MELDPETLSAADRYKLLIGCILPRPIAVVSTISPDGRPNVAPFSFFNGVGSDPMTLLFCPANHELGGEKDTLRNCKPASEGGQGEFVVNVASSWYAMPMAASAERLAYGESEWDLAGLTPAPSVKVRPARIAESPVAFECRTVQVIRLNPGSPEGGNVVLGRVVHIHLADGVANERLHVDPAKLDVIGRLGGSLYCSTRERFALPRGREALGKQSPLPPLRG